MAGGRVALVRTNQDRTFRMPRLATDALVQLIGDIKAARAARRTDEELKQARDFQRRAQFYLDFIEAGNSMGFHASRRARRAKVHAATTWMRVRRRRAPLHSGARH